MDEKKGKKRSKASLESQYFSEARSWDEDKTIRIQRSEKRAWVITLLVTSLAVLEAFALFTLLPLKTIEPFVIRVDNNTGFVDVISTLTETDGEVKESAQEVLDKYWLGQYIRHREGYQWETREYDRKLVGLLSDISMQQEYAVYTDPTNNPNAPVLMYSNTSEVDITIKAISMINTESIKGIRHRTALVRYTKEIKRTGERNVLTHWSATVTFIYLNSPMDIKDRQLNPLGFQVVAYRNDQESIGG